MKFEYKIPQLDLSTLDEKVLNTDVMTKLCEMISSELAKKVDEACVKNIIMKAKAYDSEFNPYTVSKNERKQEIRNFCKWCLQKISEEKMNKKEIVKLIEKYSVR